MRLRWLLISLVFAVATTAFAQDTPEAKAKALMTAEVAVFLPSIARFRYVYLNQLIESGTLAALALDATPGRTWSRSRRTAGSPVTSSSGWRRTSRRPPTG